MSDYGLVIGRYANVPNESMQYLCLKEPRCGLSQSQLEDGELVLAGEFFILPNGIMLRTHVLLDIGDDRHADIHLEMIKRTLCFTCAVGPLAPRESAEYTSFMTDAMALGSSQSRLNSLLLLNMTLRPQPVKSFGDRNRLKQL